MGEMALAIRRLGSDAMNPTVVVGGGLVTNAVSLIILLTLFIWTAKSSIFEAEGKDDGDDRWFDMDLNREERAALSQAASLLVLVVSALLHFVPLWRSFSSFDRFNVGSLAASTFVLANQMVIAFWYMVYFGRDEEQDGEGKNDNDDNYEVDAEELLAKHRKVTSSLCMVLAVLYFALTGVALHAGKQIPESSQTSSSDQVFVNKSYAYVEILTGLWKIISSVTVAISCILFIASCAISSGEEGERLREEGTVTNLIMVSFWLSVLSVSIYFVSGKILESKSHGVLGVGALSGCCIFMGLLLLQIYFMWAGPIMEDRGREDGVGPSVVLGFASFFLSFAYFVFAIALSKYRHSIVYVALASTEERSDLVQMEDQAPASEQQMGAYAGSDFEAPASASEQERGELNYG